MTLNFRLFFALFSAFALTIIPLPEIVVGFRPAWILLLVLYIQFFLPNYFNITLLFFLGLCLDVLLSTVIGEHAFAFLLTTWFASRMARRFNLFSIIQQMALVALYCLIYQLTIYLVGAFLGYNPSLLMVVGTTLFSMLLWPWVGKVLINGIFVAQGHR